MEFLSIALKAGLYSGATHGRQQIAKSGCTMDEKPEENGKKTEGNFKKQKEMAKNALMGQKWHTTRVTILWPLWPG